MTAWVGAIGEYLSKSRILARLLDKGYRYVIHPSETAQGLTSADLNFGFDPGEVDRYGVNTTPGTTDMSGAFSTAFQVAARLGCRVRWGATAPYALNNPVNCTGIHGVIATDESSGAASASAFCSLIIGHSGHAFDLSTSYECTFENLTVKTAAGKVPKSLFFCARNAAGSGAGLHRFRNIRTASTSTFTVIGYQYASEENVWSDCELYQAEAGSACLSFNSDNPQGWTSSFVAIAAGSQSNVKHTVVGCDFFQLGNSGAQNETCIQLENVGNFTCTGGLFACAYGRSYVDIIGGQAANNLAFRDMRAEIMGGGQQPQYGYYIANSAGIDNEITLDNCQADAVNELVRCAAGVSVQALNIVNGCAATSGKTLNAYTLADSKVETLQSGTVFGQAGGNVSNNLFIGARANVDLTGAYSQNLYADVLSGAFGLDKDRYVAANTACTGALATAVSWFLQLSPDGKQVTLSLPATQGVTSAAASFSYGIAVPAQYLPAASLRQPVVIEDNGGTLNQLGQFFLNAATGVMTIYKDIVGTANFTNGGNGGLPALTQITWTL